LGKNKDKKVKTLKKTKNVVGFYVTKKNEKSFYDAVENNIKKQKRTQEIDLSCIKREEIKKDDSK